jgi:hypothetical protein
MKKLLLIVLMGLPLLAGAEERQILSDGNMKLTGYGAPVIKITEIKGNNKLLLGGQAGCLVNDHVYVGAGGGTTLDDIGDGYASYSYFGACLGTFIKPNDAIHFFVEVGAYTGNISSGGPNPATSSTGNARAEDFSFVEPAVGLAFNISKNAKCMLGASYKFANSVDRDDLSEDDLGGYSVNVAVVFGSF